MARRLIQNRSFLTGVVPESSSLLTGELAINFEDGKIFGKHIDGTVVNLSGAPELHTHTISQVTGLQIALDGKVPLNGTGASGTWSISITGNAGTVTNGVYTSRTLTAGDGLSGGGDLSANRSFAVDATVVRTSGNQTIGGVKTFSSTISGSISGNAATVTNGVYTTGSYANPSWLTSLDYSKLSGTIPTWNQNTTGNASTATALATARTINGTSFNGTANITTANWGTTRTLTVGATGKSVNGSANVSWSLSEIGAAAATAVSVISTNTTAVANTHYVITANLTLTLPASPAAGTTVEFTNRSSTDTVTIARNGQNIMGVAENMVLNSVNAFGKLRFADATRGWVLV